jgi:hypothetical protein
LKNFGARRRAMKNPYDPPKRFSFGKATRVLLAAIIFGPAFTGAFTSQKQMKRLSLEELMDVDVRVYLVSKRP